MGTNPLQREAGAEYNRRHGVETTEAMQQNMHGKRNDMIVRDRAMVTAPEHFSNAPGPR